MKQFFLFLAFLVCAEIVHAQAGVRYDSQVIEVAANIVASNGAVLVAPQSPVIVFCNAPASGVPCSNRATTYTDATMGTACSTSTQIVLSGTNTCVASPDAQNNWGVWVAAGQYTYTITVGGANYGPYYVTAGGSGGGGGTPGGSNTQLQYNNAGAFGGAASLIYSNSSGYTTLINPTPATSLANQQAPSLQWQSQEWSGSASVTSTWTCGPQIAAPEIFACSNAGSQTSASQLGWRIPANLIIQNANFFYGTFTHSNTANRTYTFPDLSGNVCLTTTCVLGSITNGYIPYQTSTGLMNSNCDQGVTTSNVLTCIPTGGASVTTQIVVPSDGVHPSVTALSGNTTLPAAVSNAYNIIGPPVTTYTAWEDQPAASTGGGPTVNQSAKIYPAAGGAPVSSQWVFSPISVLVGSLNETGVSTANSGSAQNIGATTGIGHYRIGLYVNESAGCTTVGSGALTVTLGWVDSGHSAVSPTLTLTPAATLSTADYVSSTQDMWSISGDITVTATYVACTTGTWTYDLHATMERVQ